MVPQVWLFKRCLLAEEWRSFSPCRSTCCSRLDQSLGLPQQAGSSFNAEWEQQMQLGISSRSLSAGASGGCRRARAGDRGGRIRPAGAAALLQQRLGLVQAHPPCCIPRVGFPRPDAGLPGTPPSARSRLSDLHAGRCPGTGAAWRSISTCPSTVSMLFRGRASQSLLMHQFLLNIFVELPVGDRCGVVTEGCLGVNVRVGLPVRRRRLQTSERSCGRIGHRQRSSRLSWRQLAMRMEQAPWPAQASQQLLRCALLSDVALIFPEDLRRHHSG